MKHIILTLTAITFLLCTFRVLAQTTNPKYANEPKYFKYNLGKLKITAIYDGYNEMSRKDYVINADRETVDRALLPVHFPQDSLILPFTATVIDNGGHLIVFDTGVGEASYKDTQGKLGRFLTNFRAAGLDPDKVDYVIISHFHRDHISGLLDANDQPVFRHAKVFVPADEYDFWMNPKNMSDSDPDVIKGNFARAQKIFKIITPERIGQNTEILPGIRSINTHGHTPGHTSYLVTSGNKKLLLQGDLSNIPILFLPHPRWHVWSDMDKDGAAAKRLSIYDKAVSEHWYVQGFHFPFPAVGTLVKQGDGYRLIPLFKQ